MLKGKTIKPITESSLLKGKVINTISEAPMLKPKKVINACSSYEPIFEKDLEDLKTIYTKKINNDSNTIEIIERTKNLRYSVDFLKNKFPGYSSLYYIELFDLLESTDYNLNAENLNTNLQKFILLGNNIQSQISRLNDILSVKPASYTKIKDEISDKIGFFTSVDTIYDLYNEFNIKINDLYMFIYKEYNNLKNIDFNKYNLIYLYFDFLKFIVDELKDKQLMSADEIANSTIGSRILSLSSSTQVLNQFKSLIQIEQNALEQELDNLKNYLNILNPSLDLLKHQNNDEFKKQFKCLVKD